MARNKNYCLLPGLVTLILNVCSQAGAQESAASPQSTERFAITFGAFVTDRVSRTRLDSNDHDGTEISFEDDLGLQSSHTVARLGGYGWLGSRHRHRVDIEIFDLSRNVTDQLSKDIIFGDEIFTAGTVVETNSDVTIINVDYTFALLVRERGYFGLVGGLHVTEMTMGLHASGVGTTETATLTAPLPLFGVRGEYALSDRFTLRGAAQRLVLEIDSTTGAFSDLYAGVDYRFESNLALGLAYNAVSMDIEAKKNDFAGRLDWRYDGFLLYMSYTF